MKDKIKLKGSETKSQLISILQKFDIACSNRELKNDLIVKIDHYNKCIDENIEFKSKFNVNERFEFLEELTEMVKDGKSNSLLVLGEGGIGKTYTVLEKLKTKNTLINFFNSKEESFHICKGHSTSRGLYNTLYDHNNKLIVFDDCDSVLEDKIAQNILKSALDSYDKRTISWSKKMPKGDDYPQEFEFTGSIIFISNKRKSQIHQPLLDRGFVVNLEMSKSEKIDRMAHIMPNLIQDKFSLNDGYAALEFIRINMENTTNLSIRSLIDVLKIKANKKENWQKLAEYVLTD